MQTVDANNRLRFAVRNQSWTLALLVAGLTIGCINAWLWVAKEGKTIQEEQENQDE